MPHSRARGAPCSVPTQLQLPDASPPARILLLPPHTAALAQFVPPKQPGAARSRPVPSGDSAESPLPLGPVQPGPGGRHVGRARPRSARSRHAAAPTTPSRPPPAVNPLRRRGGSAAAAGPWLPTPGPSPLPAAAAASWRGRCRAPHRVPAPHGRPRLGPARGGGGSASRPGPARPRRPLGSRAPGPRCSS